MIRRFGGWVLLLSFLLLCTGTPEAPAAEWQLERTVDVAPVWAGHRVGFCLLTHGRRQFVAFYDADRNMTIGSRTIDSDRWQFARLPSKLGWDSHNYVTMAVDSQGHIHVSGNMHCVPLTYFRTTRPYDITSFERIPNMVGRNEQRCTYPRFLHGTADELIFVYRDGGSGNGSRYFNVYRPETGSWERLFEEPLFSGQGKMNAYFIGPVRGPNGMFHVCWVWRDTPDCATNHHLSYVRSRDLIHWETSGGESLELPITLETGEVIDPVPPGGGMINGNTKLGFDAQGRVIVSYHKFDAAGNTQIYNARREADGWQIHQATDWDYRWDFQGRGSMRFQVSLGPVAVGPDGTLIQSFRNAKDGSSTRRLDPRTLKATGPADAPEQLPRAITRGESARPNMAFRTASDLGQSEEAAVRYLLRWQSFPSNQDRPHPDGAPPASTLRLHEIRRR